MSAQYKIKTPEDFLRQSSPACRTCKNFGTASCPNFQKAIKNGLQPEDLKKAIKKDQAGKRLNPCPNAN